MSSLNLLGYTTRVETPFVQVTIGEYTFGVYENRDLQSGRDSLGVFRLQKVKYPNFVQSLNITKINGRVNKYTLLLSYAITQDNDPNFFEKVFSSVSNSRKIVFSYGDLSAPTFIYGNEEAIITSITSQFNARGANIDYTISAVSSSILASSGSHIFTGRIAKPSDVIKEMLYAPKYGLLEVFPGMRNRSLIETKGLIASNDKAVNLLGKVNISALEYLNYLVSCMSVDGSNTLQKNSVYSLVIVDDTSGDFEGPYFKVVMVSKLTDDLQTYEIDIGYPSQNIVLAFGIENNLTYSLFYNYQRKVNDAEFTQRIDDRGNLVEVYSPIIATGNRNLTVGESDKTWWTKVTEYPITASITLKGLLRPALLMTRVRLNVFYFGRKHISSGLYIVTAQEDQIDFNGYRTTLKITRISPDNSEFIIDNRGNTPKPNLQVTEN
jgi:hypothetical protein